VLALLLLVPWVLGLLFDPRYRDFLNAAIAVPAVALLLLPVARGPRLAELAIAAALLLGGLLVVLREGPENHQALLWGLLAVLAGLGLRPLAGRPFTGWPRRPSRSAPAPAGPA
jgi:hypothetical protein